MYILLYFNNMHIKKSDFQDLLKDFNKIYTSKCELVRLFAKEINKIPNETFNKKGSTLYITLAYKL